MGNTLTQRLNPGQDSDRSLNAYEWPVSLKTPTSYQARGSEVSRCFAAGQVLVCCVEEYCSRWTLLRPVLLTSKVRGVLDPFFESIGTYLRPEVIVFLVDRRWIYWRKTWCNNVSSLFLLIEELIVYDRSYTAATCFVKPGHWTVKYWLMWQDLLPCQCELYFPSQKSRWIKWTDI